MHIYLDNIGCRLNWSEIEMLARQFTTAGHSVVATPQSANVIILNTCAVTAQAERKTRHQVRSLHRDNPQARIAVIGCYPTLRPETCADFPGVAWVVANEKKSSTVDLVTAERLPSTSWREPADGAGMLRTRGFIKVQDGCDHQCTYCIITSLRGPSRSRPLTAITAEVATLIEEAGCKEAVLTGASLGAYGRDLGLIDGLRTLVRTLLHDTEIARIRLSSLEPWDVDEALFELWADTRLCRQIHLPLQAGCDATLRRMGRPTSREAFSRLVHAARASIPDLAVTTDVLVGFPGENEDAFHESYEFVKQMTFAKLHVFPYSRRPGTPAARLPDQVPRTVRDRRARRMRSLGAEQRRRFQRQFIGREMKVLWEQRQRDSRWVGWTDNYIRVAARAETNLRNQITGARLLALENGHLEGAVVP